jgi:anti-sigma B factor antagonist
MINIEKKDKIDIISFRVNRIDALITEDIKTEINRVIESSTPKVIIDLKGIEYIDSSGFSCLLSLMKSARNNFVVLKFANPEPRVMELLQNLHLHTILQIYDDIDVCVRSFM